MVHPIRQSSTRIFGENLKKFALLCLGTVTQGFSNPLIANLK